MAIADLSRLLYPGTTKTRIAVPLRTFNKIEAFELGHLSTSYFDSFKEKTSFSLIPETKNKPKNAKKKIKTDAQVSSKTSKKSQLTSNTKKKSKSVEQTNSNTSKKSKKSKKSQLASNTQTKTNKETELKNVYLKTIIVFVSLVSFKYFYINFFLDNRPRDNSTFYVCRRIQKITFCNRCL